MILTGGCQCGRVRYEADVANHDAYLCHCRMCRRATGSAAADMVGLPKADVRWLTEEPAYYRSSPIGRRGFCATCGTPMTFDYPDSDKMDLTLGTFDDPGFFRPTHEFAIDTRLEAWRDTTGLPGYRLDQNPGTVDRWIKAVGKLPD